MKVDLEGQALSATSSGYLHEVSFSDGALLHLESDFALHGPDGVSFSYSPTEPRGANPLLQFVGRAVKSAWADEESGTLTIIFADGWSITVRPDPRFEADICAPG